MKNKKPNAELVWKQLEDYGVTTLHLSVTDRVVYSHLLRHSRLEGKLTLRFSLFWLARGTGLTRNPVRNALRRLASLGLLRLVERGTAGHVATVRLPGEIRAVREAERPAAPPKPADLEAADFLQTKAMRQAIHAREGGFCFYCMRRLMPTIRCLDHVVPRVQRGQNSYRNLVSCCVECNSRKKEQHARDFLRWLYRERHLTGADFRARLRALDALAAGKLRPPQPPLPDPGNPLPRRGRPRIGPARVSDSFAPWRSRVW